MTSTVPGRLAPLFDEFDWGCGRLVARLRGPERDSGNGTLVPDTPLTDAEYLWEPVPGRCWSVRARAHGPGPGAQLLVGGGAWGRDSCEPPHPVPPPVTTIAWRLSHLTEMLALRAEYSGGGGRLDREDIPAQPDAAGAIAAFERAAAAWRSTLTSVDEAALDTVGYSSYPYGSDPQDPFLEIVWWVNQEVLHHGAEIALLRDLYRAGFALRIRAAEDADRPAIAELLTSSWGSTTVVAHGTAFAADTLPALLAEQDGETVGLLTYALSDTELEVVSLDAFRRHLGIGTALLNAAAELARRSGAARLFLVTTNDNLDALRFYQRRGLRIVAVTPGGVDADRLLKPSIPHVGEYGISLRDELTLELRLP